MIGGLPIDRLGHASRRPRQPESGGRLTAPLLIIVTGPPAAGKTTIARALATELGLPLLSRDALKEILFEELGWSDRAWSQRLGRATWPLLYHVVAEELRAGRSLIVEANFEPAFAEPEFGCLPPFRALQVYCTAEPEVVRERFAARARDAGRHPGHVDETIAAEIAAALDASRWRPLDLAGERIDVDTSDSAPIQVGPLAQRIRRLAD